MILTSSMRILRSAVYNIAGKMMKARFELSSDPHESLLSPPLKAHEQQGHEAQSGINISIYGLLTCLEGFGGWFT